MHLRLYICLSWYVICLTSNVPPIHAEDTNAALEKIKRDIVGTIRSRTSAIAKKLTVESIALKRAKRDEEIIEAEVIPIATEVSVCDKVIDLTTSSPDDVPTDTARWSQTDRLSPRQLKPNPSSKVKRQTTGRIQFQTIEELTRLILDDPGNDILDPPECKCPSCPYCRGCMATQRYVLLERCLQIDNLFKLRPDLYGVAVTGLEDYE